MPQWHPLTLPPLAPPAQAVRLGDCLEPGLRGSFFEAVRKRGDWLLCALLRDRATQRHLLAGCTHLFADPRFPDIKVGWGSWGHQLAG